MGSLVVVPFGGCGIGFYPVNPSTGWPLGAPSVQTSGRLGLPLANGGRIRGTRHYLAGRSKKILHGPIIKTIHPLWFVESFLLIISTKIKFKMIINKLFKWTTRIIRLNKLGLLNFPIDCVVCVLMQREYVFNKIMKYMQ